MAKAPIIEDEWDFYPCRVDDAPASIYLNLGFEHRAPLAGASTLYWIQIHMLDAAEHGMGSSSEAKALYPVEDRLSERALVHALVFVGRLRNNRIWQLTFYGPAEQVDALRELVQGTKELGKRKVEVDSKPDADWRYYRAFLLPDTERRQWIQDRRVVDVLEGKGDTLVRPRRVDHWAYFSTAKARDAFVRDAAKKGFVTQSMKNDAEGARSFSAQVHRCDEVELDHIHGVVMQLFEVAQRHGGDYDGWETSVEKDLAAHDE